MHSNLQVDFPAAIRAAFPAEFESASNAVQAVLAGIGGRDRSPLARHSSGPAGFDNHLRMDADPTMREITFSVSRRTQ